MRRPATADLLAASYAYFEADVGPIAPEVAAALPCFVWDMDRLRGYPAPVRSLPLTTVRHFLDAPVWRRAGGRPFTLSPTEVVAAPARHRAHHEQAMRADLSFPIDLIDCADGRRLADGYHRLLKATVIGEEEILARLIPEAAIPLVLADLATMPPPRGGARSA